MGRALELVNMTWPDTYLDKRHIKVKQLAPKKMRNFAQEDWCEVSSSFIDRFSAVSADEERVRTENPCEIVNRPNDCKISLLGRHIIYSQLSRTELKTKYQPAVVAVFINKNKQFIHSFLL